MRDYGRVYSSFWQSPETRALSEDGRTLALYLLTSPHANLIGCFRLPDAYAADDLQWASGRVSEGFRELAEKGFLTRDDGTKWVFIRKYLKWNGFENGNVAKAAAKAFDKAPNGLVKSLLALALLEFGEHLSAEFRSLCESEAAKDWNPSRTLPKPFANPEPEPEPEPEPFQNQNQAGTSFDAPPLGMPRRQFLRLSRSKQKLRGQSPRLPRRGRHTRRLTGLDTKPTRFVTRR